MEHQGKHTIIDGPFTDVFSQYTNPERRYIHSLLMRYYQLHRKPRRSRIENKEMKALIWVVDVLKEVENE